MVRKLILVLGGARSGKSVLAERLATELGGRVAYVASGVPSDPEMADRIARHRRRRPPHWQTVEEPTAVVAVLRSLKGKADVVLLDCLTVWVANLLFGFEKQGNSSPGFGCAQEEVLAKVEEMVDVARSSPFSTIVVSNEVGCGVVPPFPSGRAFRDVVGMANQVVAREADEVWFTVAGLPWRLK